MNGKIFNRENKKTCRNLILGVSIFLCAGICNATDAPTFDTSTSGIPAKIAKSPNQYVMSVNIKNNFPVTKDPINLYTKISDNSGRLTRVTSNCSEINCINDCGDELNSGRSCNIYFMFDRSKLGPFKSDVTIEAGRLYKTIHLATEVVGNVNDAEKLEWKQFPSNGTNQVSVDDTVHFDYRFSSDDPIKFTANLGDATDNRRGLSIDKIACNGSEFEPFDLKKVYSLESGNLCDIKLKYTPTETGELNTFLVVKPNFKGINSLVHNLKILAVNSGAQQGLVFWDKHPVPSTLKKIYVGTKLRAQYKVYNLSRIKVKIKSVDLNEATVNKISIDHRVENSCVNDKGHGAQLDPYGMCNIFVEYDTKPVVNPDKNMLYATDNEETASWSVKVSYDNDKTLESDPVTIEAVDGLEFKKIEAQDGNHDSSYSSVNNIAVGYNKIFIFGQKADSDDYKLNEFYYNDGWKYKSYSRISALDLKANVSKIEVIKLNNDKEIVLGLYYSDIMEQSCFFKGNILNSVIDNTEGDVKLEEKCINDGMWSDIIVKGENVILSKKEGRTDNLCSTSIVNIQDDWNCHENKEELFPSGEDWKDLALIRGDSNNLFYRWSMHDSDYNFDLGISNVPNSNIGLSLSNIKHFKVGEGFSYLDNKKLRLYDAGEGLNVGAFLGATTFDSTYDQNIVKDKMAYADYKYNSQDLKKDNEENFYGYETINNKVYVGIFYDSSPSFSWDIYYVKNIFGELFNSYTLVADIIKFNGEMLVVAKDNSGFALGLLGSDDSYDTWLVFDKNLVFKNGLLSNLIFDKAGSGRVYLLGLNNRKIMEMPNSIIKVAENLIPPVTPTPPGNK